MDLEAYDRVKAQRSAAERRKTPHVFAGVDLQAEAKRYCRALGLALPEIRFRHSPKQHSSGRAWSHRRRVVLTIGCSPLSDVLELLLHELTHIATPGHHHDETYRATLVRAAREVWGVDAAGWLSVERGAEKCRAYAFDRRLAAELGERLGQGLYVPVLVPAQVAPAPTVPSLAERRQARAQSREAHVRKLLAEHERKLKREQRLVKKYRVKVRYYEQRAAASENRLRK